jgi:hypothetical protein
MSEFEDSDSGTGDLRRVEALIKTIPKQKMEQSKFQDRISVCSLKTERYGCREPNGARGIAIK